MVDLVSFYVLSAAGLPSLLRQAPLMLSLTIVALVTNVSAVRRFALIARRTRELQDARPVHPSSTTPVSH